MKPNKFIYFHGYKVFPCGKVLGKTGKPLSSDLRKRNGGGVDVCVRLSYNGKRKKWTLQGAWIHTKKLRNAGIDL